MYDAAPKAVATAWLTDFSEAVSANNVASLLELFGEDCYWRDFLAFS